MKTSRTYFQKVYSIIALMYMTATVSATHFPNYDVNSDDGYLSIVMMDVTFSQMPTTWCYSETLILPEVSDEGEGGVWSPSRIIDSRILENSIGQTIQVAFFPFNTSLNFQVFDIQIAGPPYLGVEQTESLKFCKTGGDIIVDLVDTLDLQLEKIMTLQGDAQLFAFVESNSFNPSDFETEMRNLNLRDIPEGPYAFFVEASDTVPCYDEIASFELEIQSVYAGDDTEITICQGDDSFHDFVRILGTVNRTSSNWSELNGTNSGVDLSSPTSVDLSMAALGTYVFEHEVVGDGACTGFTESANLTVNVVSNSTLNVVESDLTICSRSSINTLNLELSGIAPYDVTIQLEDDQGVLYVPYTFTTSDTEVSLEVMHTTGMTRIENDIIYVNQTSEFYNILPYRLIDSKTSQCAEQNLVGSTRISFEFVELDVQNTVCQGGSFFFLGETFDENKSSGEVLLSGECDTIYNVQLDFDPVIERSITQEICENDIVQIKGQTFSRNNTSASVLFNDGGCDTLFDISVTLLERTISNETYELCPGETITVGANTYDLDNPTGTEVMTASNGCDSIIVVNVTPQPTLNTEVSNMNCEGIIDMVLCEGDTVEVGNEIFDMNRTTGMIMLTSARGCDSLVEVNLFYSAPVEEDYSETLCGDQSRTIGGQLFDQNNPTGTVVLTGSNGCDSIVNVNLTYGTGVVNDLSETICPGEVYDFGNGVILSEANLTQTENLVTALGCDSTVNYSITVNPSYSEDLIDDYCEGESLIVGGTTFDINNPSGVVSLLTTEGCDSIINVDLTFNAHTNNDIVETFCDNSEIIVGTTTFNEANPSGQVILTNAAGCDSIVNVSLTYGIAVTNDIEETICEGGSFDFGNGIILDEFNLTQTANLVTDDGCDSIVNYSITINSVFSEIVEDVLCEGESMTIGSTTFDINNPSGFVNLTTAEGCDSIIDVNLTFNEHTQFDIIETICDNAEITVGSTTFNEANPSGQVTLTNASGCDSIVNVSLTYGTATTVEVMEEICEGGSFDFGNGIILDELNPSGSITLSSESGCDSVVNYSISVNEVYLENVNFEVCDGGSIEIGNTTFDANNTSGMVTLMSSTGCDSMLDVSISILDPIITDLARSFCGNGEVTVGSETFNEANPSGQVTLTSAAGCDSVVNVTLSFGQANSYDVNELVCEGESYDFGNGIVLDANNPTGSMTFSSGDGCDSIVNYSISEVAPTYGELRENVCIGDSYFFRGVAFSPSRPSETFTLTNALGCDSILLVEPNFFAAGRSSLDTALCVGEVLRIGDLEYTENYNGEVRMINQSAAGCDSIVSLRVNFHVNIPGPDFVQTICPGEEVVVGGITFDENNLSGPAIIVNPNGCDTLVQVNLTLEEELSSNLERTICPGSSIEIEGVTYDESNLTGSYTVPSSIGCDSTIFVNVTVQENITTTLNETICAGESIIINGITYDESNLTGSTVETAASGCDSTVMVNVTVSESVTTTINESICQGQSIEINNVTYDENNLTGQTTLQSASGCDSTVMVNVEILQPASSTVEESICSGSSIDINGITYDENNLTGQSTITAANGCDSVVFVNVTVSEEIITNINESICEGGFITIDGVIYNENNLTGQITHQSASGCDSTVMVNVDVIQSTSSTINETICAGSSLMINGVEYNENNTSGQTILASASGCDSTVFVNIDVLPEISTNYTDALCEGESVVIGSTTFDIDNPNGQVTLSASNGCDSIVDVEITFNTSSSSLIEQSFCEDTDVVVGGNTFNEANPSGQVTLVSATGCDSIVDVSLTFGQANSYDVSQAICEGESFDFGNGIVLDANNTTESMTFSSGSGCDSIVNYSVTTLETTYGELRENVCIGEAYFFRGVAFSPTNRPSETFTLTNAQGCDSVLLVAPNFFPVGRSTLDTALCVGEVLRVGDLEYTENYNGEVRMINASAAGCDSIVTLRVNFHTNIPGPDYERTICSGEQVQLGGQIFDENNLTGQAIIANTMGCDTLINVNLTLAEELSSTIEETICPGSSIMIEGQLYDENNLSGQFTVPSGGGCDSTVYINVTVRPEITATVNETICPGSSIDINGITYDENNLSGQSILSASDGCDSTVFVNITVEAERTGTLSESICQGGSIMINGTLYDENNLSGQFSTSTVDGCDSTVFVTVSVNEPISSSMTETICQGDFFEIQGQIFDENNTSGQVSYQTDAGCDSTVFVNIVIAEPSISVRDTTVCASEFGTGINSAEVISDTMRLVSAAGCDSLLVLNMHLIESSNSSYVETLCAGESVTIGSSLFDINNPVGTVILAAANGCDSIVDVDLTYLTSVEETIEEQLCEGDEIMVNNVAYNINNPRGIETITLANGCDSIVIIDLTFRTQMTTLIDNILCEEETVTVNNVVYDINTPRGSQTMISANGCDSIIEIDLTFSVPEVTMINESLCVGEEYEVANRVFDRFNPSGTVTLQNAYGCDSIIDVSIDFTDLEAEVRGLAVCPDNLSDGSIMIESVINGMGPYSYSINGGDQNIINEFPFEITDLRQGQYEVEIYDAEGCSEMSSIFIAEPQRVDMSISYVEVEDGVYDLELLHTGVIDSFRWETLGDLSCEDCLLPSVSIDETTIVTAYIFDEYGCMRSTDIILDFSRRVTADVANIISVNSTTGNDKLFLTLEDSENIEYDLMIFNRWGEIIHRANGLTPNDPSMGWDGTRAGQELNTGVYIYEMIVRHNNEVVDVVHGDITLID